MPTFWDKGKYVLQVSQTGVEKNVSTHLGLWLGTVFHTSRTGVENKSNHIGLMWIFFTEIQLLTRVEKMFSAILDRG